MGTTVSIETRGRLEVVDEAVGVGEMGPALDTMELLFGRHQ